jgi:hypothetical protein
MCGWLGDTPSAWSGLPNPTPLQNTIVAVLLNMSAAFVIAMIVVIIRAVQQPAATAKPAALRQ